MPFAQHTPDLDIWGIGAGNAKSLLQRGLGWTIPGEHPQVCSHPQVCFSPQNRDNKLPKKATKQTSTYIYTNIRAPRWMHMEIEQTDRQTDTQVPEAAQLPRKINGLSLSSSKSFLCFLCTHSRLRQCSSSIPAAELGRSPRICAGRGLGRCWEQIPVQQEHLMHS